MVRRWSNVVRLALRDYFQEWVMSSCFVLALAAVLGPMMVLFGLKFGIVGSMVEQLVQDPRNREVRPVGSGHYDHAWLDQLRQQPGVEFLVPRTRSIAATIKLRSKQSPMILPVELEPSAQGDPLLTGVSAIPDGLERIVLSESAAEKLNVSPGDTVEGYLTRRFRGRSERVSLPLEVTDVAHAGAFNRDGAFVSVGLLEALEDFRDGRGVPELRWTGDSPRDDAGRTYPGFRLYAGSIYDVGPLSDRLTAAGVEVRTRAADIEVVQRMDRNLSLVFWVVAAIGLTGFSLSLGASLWANVDRKRRELSVLRLVGFRTGDIIWFPVLQSLFTAIIGSGLAFAIYLGVAYTINTLLAAQLSAEQTVCRLLPEHYLIAFGLTAGSAVLAAALAGLRSARIEPSEGLREI